MSSSTLPLAGTILYTPTEDGLKDIAEFTEGEPEESLRARTQALSTKRLVQDVSTNVHPP